MDTIDIHAQIDRINDARESLHLTQQQLADASGVPLATVTRILAHKTDNPTYATIIALERAVGLTFESAPPEMPKQTGDPTKDLVELYRHQLAQQRHDFEVRLATQRREYRMRESFHRRLSKILAIALATVIVLLIAVLIYDALNGDIGYIRYYSPIQKFVDRIFGKT